MGKFLPLPVEKLRRWFLKNRRDLPWRQKRSPYQVWVSEIMLQQTQVSVVLRYFEKWMQHFPTLEALAQTPLEQVIKLWEGLGYYSRARNLHKGALYVQKHHGGELPQDKEALKKVPGIGSYTLGAILSFAFEEKAAAVDGNVERVISRFLAIEEEISSLAVKRAIHSYVQDHLPDQEPWVIAEGLIELGALVCTKNPKCMECPLSAECLGLKKGIADLLPMKRKKEKPVVLERDVFVILAEEGREVLLSKGKSGKVMADLYEFPYVEKGGEFFPFKQEEGMRLPEMKHTFTRFRVTLSPYLFYLDRKRDVPGYEWIVFSKIGSLPFSSGHRRVLKFIQDTAFYTRKVRADGALAKCGSCEKLKD